MAKQKTSETPLMKQHNAIKAKHPDALLLFRVGDFYETFGQDAITTSEVLGIVLTKRKNGAAAYIELAGFPHHSLDTYLPKLVRAGHRVAICDQLEDPKATKSIVKRGVTELVTPGVSYNDKVLDHDNNNFLAAVYFDKKEAGVGFLDVSTGEFLVGQGSLDYVDKLLRSFDAREIIYQRNHKKNLLDAFGEKYYSYPLEDWAFSDEFANDLLKKHFGTATLKGFGIQEKPLGVIAGGAALHYLAETQHDRVRHITSISRIEEEEYVWLDRFTIRNLELLYSPHEGATSLLEIVDKTSSPMGSRLLKRWIALPLKNKKVIEERLSIVDYLLNNEETSDIVLKSIKEIGDLERLISKAAVGRINPREVMQLKTGLEAILPIKEACKQAKSKELNNMGKRLNACKEVRKRIEHDIQEDPPVQLAKGNAIKQGVSKELDELREIAYSGKDFLVQLQQREIERTGISSLKVGFNNVFGYYLEVTHAHKDKVPEEWVRKQTLVNAERYITEELKEYESKILGAEEKILALEAKLFEALVLDLTNYIVPIQENAQVVAQLDCLQSFAIVSKKNNYVRPEVNDSLELNITEGRHPVIEQQLPLGEVYVTNDVLLNEKQQQVMMITGPNMSGKSALLRQTALIVLMAQTGCFVPAASAKIGLVDKVFTRVGASDNISLGESTFMVEMNETASILNNLSERSLILLDEIGRGTSTYDGISIAWSIAEYLHEHASRPKTLFATHYHELNQMADTFGRIKNYNVSVKELDNKVIFLRKLVAGGSEHSFGIHVAQMAGMPKKTLKRANEVLKYLEDSREGTSKSANDAISLPESDMQLSFFQLDDPVLSQVKDEIQNTDIDTLTPVEALMKLNEIKKLIGG